MKKLLYTILLGLLISNSISAQDWIVPGAQKGKLANFEFSETNIESGSSIFLTNCRTCHGIPGEGNPMPLVPPPGDPADTKFQGNSDGELYYKIREGRGQMASFKKVMTISQVWDVISYLRSFNSDYIQRVAAPATDNRWTDLNIGLTLLSSEHQIRAEVSGMEDGNRTPVTGAEIRLMVKRKFGNLQLGEVIMTDLEGIALFSAPLDLPGDEEGNLSLIVQLNDEEKFGLVLSEAVLAAGMPFTPVSLTAERAMWNINKKAPIWLILTYCLGLLTAWGFIFYVMLQLKSIYKLGKEEENH
ncbi:MAG: c-type cytochrome [Bacteroidales bacterium]|nr:c-type cytochrome [Bacteroidales bacterium]